MEYNVLILSPMLKKSSARKIRGKANKEARWVAIDSTTLRCAVNAEVNDHPRSQTQRGVHTVSTETFAMNFESLSVSSEFDAYINSAVHKKVYVPGSISRIAKVWANGRPKRKRNNRCPANRYGEIPGITSKNTHYIKYVVTYAKNDI